MNKRDRRLPQARQRRVPRPVGTGWDFADWGVNDAD